MYLHDLFLSPYIEVGVSVWVVSIFFKCGPAWVQRAKKAHEFPGRHAGMDPHVIG